MLSLQFVMLNTTFYFSCTSHNIEKMMKICTIWRRGVKGNFPGVSYSSSVQFSTIPSTSQGYTFGYLSHGYYITHRTCLTILHHHSSRKWTTNEPIATPLLSPSGCTRQFCNRRRWLIARCFYSRTKAVPSWELSDINHNVR